MARNLVYWDSARGLTRYGRTKHIPAGGEWTWDGPNIGLCGRPLPKPVNSWEALNEWPTCRACQEADKNP
jgi:hypothetical protein